MASKTLTLGIDPKEDLPDTVIINLRYPLKSDLVPDMAGADGLLRSITLRRPTMRERIALNKKTLFTPVEREAAFIEALSGVPMEVLVMMDLADYEQVQDGLGKFSPTEKEASAG